MPTPSPPLPASLAKVLLIQVDHHLGNVVISFPSIRALADHFDGQVDLLIDQRYASLAEPLVDGRILPYASQRDQNGRPVMSIRESLKLFKQLFAERYDAVIDLSGGIRASGLTLSTGADHRVGRKEARRSWVYNQRLVPGPNEPAPARADEPYRRMLQAIGQTQPPPAVTLTASETERTAVRRHLDDAFGPGSADDNRPLVLIHPSAGIRWRCWPADRFAKVADELVSQRQARVALLGHPADRDLADEVIDAMRFSDDATFVGGSLGELIAWFERGALLLSNESGPTHLAALTQIPIATIFGPTSEAIWRPMRDQHLVVLRGADCLPGCHGRTCVHDRQCLLSLKPGRVREEADRLLEKSCRRHAAPMPQRLPAEPSR